MGKMIQFCGLSGAGKTTLAEKLYKQSESEGLKIKLIDGDVYRQTLCKDLGFSKEDRLENISRLGAYANTLISEYDFIIIAAINPFHEGRSLLMERYGAYLVWLKCDLSTLIKRDTKGLYKKALLPEGHADKIYNLTGVNDPFEAATTADLILETDNKSIEESLLILSDFLKKLSLTLEKQI